MATTLAELLVKVGADLKDFNKGMEQVERGLTKTMGSDAIAASQGLAMGLAAVGVAMVALGGMSIKLAADMEQNRIAFETLLGSADKANEMLHKLEEFARTTPFQFTDMVQASKHLLAVGFAAENIMPTLHAVGDAVSAVGGGAEGMQRVVEALGKMQAEGKVTARAMKSLGEMGIPAWQMLADQMGVKIPEAMKKAEQGELSAAQAIPMILQGMNDKFGGLMEKQSQSLLGMWSNTIDSLELAGRHVGEYLIKAFDLKDILKKFNEYLDQFTAHLEHGGIREVLATMIPESLQRNIGLIAGALGGALVPALIMTVTWAAKVVNGLSPFIIAGTIVGALAQVIAQNWDNVGVRWATVLGIVGVAINLFSKFNVALKIWEVTTKAVTLAQAVLNAVLTANPIGFVLIAIAGLIAAGVLLYKNWDTVKYYALEAWGTIKAFILNTAAKILDGLSGFIGFFNESWGEQLRIASESLKQQGQAERDLADERKRLRDEDAAADERASFRKQERAQEAAAAQQKTSEDTTTKDLANWKAQADGAADATATKQHWLDEFEEKFRQAHERATTEFDRDIKDQTETFKHGQEDQLRDLERSLAKKKTDFERHQEDLKTAFDRAQQDVKTKFVHDQEDAHTVFANRLQADKDVLADRMREQKDAFQARLQEWKDQFTQHQQDLLDAFKEGQQKQLDSLKDTQDKERALLDADYARQLATIKARQDAIKDEQEAEQVAKRREELLKNLQKAEEELAKAKAKGDPAQIATAEERLATATENRLAYETDLKRKAQLQQLQDQADALRAEQALKVKAMDEQHKLDAKALQEQQKKDLKAFEEDQKDQAKKFALDLKKAQEQFDAKQKLTQKHLDELFAQAIKAFERRQAKDLKNLETTQADDKTKYDRELADLKTSFEEKQAERKKDFEREQATDLERWTRAQEDRKAKFKAELDDLKLSFKGKLDAQQQFINDWNAGAARLADMVAPVAQVPMPAPASGPAQSPAQPAPIPGTLTGTPNPNGVQLWDPAHPPAVNPPSKAPPSGGKSGGGGGGAKRMALGGVVTRPTFAQIGEAGPEAVIPLDNLWKQMAAFSTRVATAMSGLAGGASPVPTMAGGGASSGVTQVILEMDSRRVAEYIVPHIPDVLRRRVGIK